MAGRMALSLKDTETDSLARQVASLTGETLTEAVRGALRLRLRDEQLKRGERPWDDAAIDAIIESLMTERTTRFWAMTRTACRPDGRRQFRADCNPPAGA